MATTRCPATRARTASNPTPATTWSTVARATTRSRSAPATTPTAAWPGDEIGNDTVDGGAGTDLIYAGAGADIVYGGSEADTIHGGTGNDTLYGGTGSDYFVVQDDGGTDSIDGGAADWDGIIFTTFTTKQGVTAVYTSNLACSYSFNGNGTSGRFSNLEGFLGTSYDDYSDASVTTTTHGI